jgi:hypothetical protein
MCGQNQKGDIGFDFKDEVAALVIWTLDVQEFVLFVLGGVLELLPKFSLCLQVYSAHLDP